ncbi:MAG TPA: helix-turn-helix domain-containing protein [Tepidisphaeraceae bacterium]|jgi:hypothetical protein
MATDSRQPDSFPNSEENDSLTGTFENNREIYHSQNLSDVQLRGIDLMTQGYTDTQAAQILSISRRTIWNWKNRDDDFREALAEARLQLHATITDRYESVILKTTAVLVKLLEDPSHVNCIKAAQILLTAASKYKPTQPTQRPMAAPEDDFPPPFLPPKVG